MKKKILIITSSIGNGHLTAAKNTQLILNKLYGKKVETEVVDFVQYTSRVLNKTIQSVYYASLRITPKVYQIFFDSSDNPKNIKRLNIINFPLLYHSTKKLMREKGPDLIFSTWPVFDNMIRRSAKNIPFVSMITDSSIVHHTWVSSNADYYIVTDNETKQAVKKKGVKENKIKVLGFPVSPIFFEQHDVEPLRKKYHLKDDTFTILALASHSKTRRIISTIKHIIPFCENVQIIIVAGKNKSVAKKISKMSPPKNVHLLGWTDNVAELMRISDVIVTKAGGATVQETIAARKPPIIHDNLPGQEVGNVDYIKNKKIGLIMVHNKPAEIASKLLQLSHGSSKEMQELRSNMQKVYKHNSTEEIGRFIGNILKL